MRPAILSLLTTLLVALPCVAQERFADAINGVQVALEPLPGARFRIHILNKGVADLDLTDAHAWLLLAESRERATYTDRILLDANTLAPDATHKLNVALAEVQVFPFAPGTKLQNGYPQTDAPPQAITQQQWPDDVRVQAMVYLKAAGEKVLVRSRSEKLVQGDSASTRPQRDLLAAFRRDAFAAKAAHEQAIKVGESCLPQLEEGLHERDMPEFGKMWIATAIIGINAGKAPAIAIAMTSHPSSGVRSVLAYHGPGMKRPEVDREIIRFATAGSDPEFTAWAARGFAERSRAFPHELITAAAQSSSPRARAEVAPVVARLKDESLSAKLAGDENEIVRVAAARALSEAKFLPSSVIHALVASLDEPGESAREVVVGALARHAGKDWQYSAEMPEEKRLMTLSMVKAYAQREPAPSP